LSSRKLLLIRGLGHSGTTILDLALGAHPRMVGLGEAARILRRPLPGEEHRGPAQLRAELRHQRVCTCGATAAQCPVWGDLLEWLPAHDHLPLADKFRRLMEAVSFAGVQAGHADDWLVDSYQDDLELPSQSFPDLDVRVVFLVRDVRSWVHSRVRDRRNKGKSLLGVRNVVRWCRVNRRFERELQRCGKPVFPLGYEELALAPDQALGRLCEWLGLEFSEAMLTPGLASGSHILSGNRVRFDPQKTRQIRYDASWLQAPAWPASAALIWPQLAQMNRRLVYANAWVGG
jgi:hypothetical protein